MSDDPLLTPFRIRHLEFKNRIMSTSHACGLEAEDAMPADDYQQYHLEKARGGIGLTMFGGSAYVDLDSTWSGGQLNMGTDRIVPYLRRFSERIHAEGAALMVQITHLGRRGETDTQNWLPTLAPSPVRERGHRSIPRELDEDDISRIVRAFGDAAARCKEGGLDGLETMVAGHLIGQFLSPVTNLRKDHYGGDLENRCRFGLMVMDEIRRRVGEDFILGMRIPITETTVPGLSLEDCVAFARVFERSGLIDYFNVNYGRIDTELSLVTDCMPGMASPLSPWLEAAGAFKKEVSLPVFHAARITDIASARYAIREGLLDMVAMTRGHIADPQIVNKIKRGEEERIRPCVGATHCMGDNRPSCVHNPASGRDRFWPQVIRPTDGPRFKIVVIGGGPAGLEAARVSAERGHEVVLFEAAEVAGGQLRLAAQASWRRDIIGIVDWRVSELEKLGVDMRLGCLADAEQVMAESPAVVINATGGLPHLEWLEGHQHCDSVWDLLSGNVPLKDSAIVFDGTGRHPALTAVDYLCQRGEGEVTLVTIDDRPGQELVYGDRSIWKRELAKTGIRIEREYGLERVEKVGADLVAHFSHELTGTPMKLEAGQVFIEHGTLPVEDVFDDLKGAALNRGKIDIHAFVNGEPQPVKPGHDGYVLYSIGDAQSSRTAAAAIFDALRLCCVL